MVEIDESVFPPKLLLQLLAGDDLPRPLQQDLEHRQGLGVQLDLDPALAEFPSAEIGLEDTEADALAAQELVRCDLRNGCGVAHVLPAPRDLLDANIP